MDYSIKIKELREKTLLLFDVDRTRIVRHINIIYGDKGLELCSTCAKNAQVQIEGNRKVTRKIKIYNSQVNA